MIRNDALVMIFSRVQLSIIGLEVYRVQYHILLFHHAERA
jgi:hypothetical protein